MHFSFPQTDNILIDCSKPSIKFQRKNNCDVLLNDFSTIFTGQHTLRIFVGVQKMPTGQWLHLNKITPSLFSAKVNNTVTLIRYLEPRVEQSYVGWLSRKIFQTNKKFSLVSSTSVSMLSFSLDVCWNVCLVETHKIFHDTSAESHKSYYFV